MLFKISLLLVLLVSVVQSHKGIDISRLYNQSVYECFKKDGFSFAIPYIGKRINNRVINLYGIFVGFGLFDKMVFKEFILFFPLFFFTKR